VFGTPRYMSPEQAQAKPLDARTDLYSLGVILYHMLAGRPPFTDDDAIIVMARHIKSNPKPLSEVAPDAKLPPEVEAFVMRVLSKDPDKRPANADVMMQEIADMTELVRSATSGVRASLSNATAQFLPRSVPPPPAALEDSLEMPTIKPRSNWPWLVAAASLLAAGAIVTWLIATRTRANTQPIVSAPTMTTSAATSVAVPASTPTSARSSPAVDVGALPKATSPKTTGRPRNPTTSSPTTTPTATTAPTPSSTRPYGIFE
jgi:serine/threonine-protein kinase